jgi:hypothetical protein
VQKLCAATRSAMTCLWFAALGDRLNDTRFQGTAFLAGCLNPQKNGFDSVAEWVLDRGDQ